MNLLIEFKYSNRWNRNLKRHRVRPYQVLLDQGRYFLFGYDETADGNCKERLFSLNRIKNISVTDETFELPDDYEFSSHCDGGRFGSFIGDEPVDFVIDFYGESREYVKEYIWADNQKLKEFDNEDKTRISLTTSQVFPVLEWVLAQGGNAIPVSPDWFVKRRRHEEQRFLRQGSCPLAAPSPQLPRGDNRHRLAIEQGALLVQLPVFTMRELNQFLLPIKL